MKIPLAKMAARIPGNARKKTAVLPANNPTSAFVTALDRVYLKVLRTWQIAIRDHVLPSYSTYTRDSSVEVSITSAEQQVDQALTTFRTMFLKWGGDLQAWHMRRIIEQIRYATNVDLTSMIHAGDELVTIEQALAENVALIRSVSDEIRGKVASSVFRGMQNRTPIREVAKEISQATGLARARAKRIASDQTVKLAANLDRDRQQQLGIDVFEWQHSGKKHYRPEHLARNGKRFAWTSVVGRNDPPGRAPFCGCKAKGVLDIEDSQEAVGFSR